MRYITLLSFSLISFYTLAQSGKYNFSSSTETYNEISGIVINSNSSLFKDSINAGFNLDLNDHISQKLYISRNYFTCNNAIQGSGLTAFGAELTEGEISYEISGNTGNKILKIQLKNLKFGHDFSQVDFINYQLWIHENGIIEIRFGPNQITNAVWDYYYDEKGPYIGFQHSWLKGNPLNPSLDTASSRIMGTPSNGRVYRFTPKNVSVNEHDKIQNLVLFPNPAADKLMIGSEGSFQIFDHQGKLLQNGKVGINKSIDIQHLSSGDYYLIFNQKQKFRFIKQ